jgi:uncharacterized protein (TIGR03437 family)
MRAFLLLAAAGCLMAAHVPANPALSLPLSFEPNVGQTDPQAMFIARGDRSKLWITAAGPVLGVPGNRMVKLRFPGANAHPKIEAEQPSAGYSNYLIGNDPSKWKTHVPQYGRVRYRDLYPGIDLVFYGNPRELEYDFVVAPGADPSRIQIRFEGARKLREDAGDLVVDLGGAEIRNRKPVIRQGGAAVEGHFAIRKGQRAAFAIGPYDRSKPLVIDPAVTYATMLGGQGGDQISSTAMDGQGNVYVAGGTTSPNFPTKAALYPQIGSPVNDPSWGFVSKFNPSGSGGASLLYSTFFGSTSGVDHVIAMAVDKAGNAYITGYTESADLPLANAFQPTWVDSTQCGTVQNAAHCPDAFVAKLSPAGDKLLFSSYLGGPDFDSPAAIALDPSGNIWVTGNTDSIGFPVRGAAYQTNMHGQQAAFISEISTSFALVYSTFVTGEAYVNSAAIAADGTAVYIAGITNSKTLGTSANSFQRTISGATTEGFVMKIDPQTSGPLGLLYGSFLGGTDSGGSQINAMALDSVGNIYLAGGTNSASFPTTTTSFPPPSNINHLALTQDAFVTKLNPSLQGTAQLVYSTYFGGSVDEVIHAIAVDSSGRITVAGTTNSIDFPSTTDAFQCCWSGVIDPSSGYVTQYGFLARIDPSKSGTAAGLYSTLIGNPLFTTITSMAMDAAGNTVAVGGWTEAIPPVTPSAYQSVFGGEIVNQYPDNRGDAYMARFDFTTTGPVLGRFENGAQLGALPGATLAPGLIFTLKGRFGLGATTTSLALLDPSTGRLATNVLGIQVYVDGIACPVTYVSATQVNAIAPYELAKKVGQTVFVQVFYNGVPGTVLSENVSATAPGILSLGDGTGQGVILNQDGSLNGPNNPAKIGSTVVIFATGEGQTTPPGIDGGLATDYNNLPKPAASASLTIGGVAVTSTPYLGTAPAEVYGLLQINAMVPAGVTPGSAVPVVLTVGSASSQKGLTMAVTN